MSDRKRYLYRLDVVYPDVPTVPDDDPFWVPEWDYENQCAGPTRWYRWPQSRMFQHRGSAEARARLLRSKGCTVTVVQSNPVTWPNTDWEAVPLPPKATNDQFATVDHGEPIPVDAQVVADILHVIANHIGGKP